jgi:cytochrome c553
MKYSFACLLAGLLFASVAVASDDLGAERYEKLCKSCHGADGSNAAMSKPLKGLPAEEVKAALVGYKAQTYGGKKKAMMERVTKSLTDEDIEALATHVGAFEK